MKNSFVISIRNIVIMNVLFVLVPLLSLGQKVPVGKKHKTSDVLNIDLRSASQKGDNLQLSKIAESIRYIPLETSDKNILNDYLRKIVITKTYIFVLAFGQGAYRFTINGKFINKIGRIGRGPEECVKPIDMVLDSINKYVILLDEDKIVKYDFSGGFIKKYPSGFASGSMLQYNENIMLLNDMDYLFKNPKERFSFKFFSLERNNTLSKIACENKDKIPFSICNPIMYNYDNQKYIKDYWSDTIYQVIDPYNLEAYAVIQTGKFKYRENDDKSVFTGVMNPDESWIVDITYISETDRFIFLVSNKGLFVFDKVQKDTFCCNFIIKDNKASLFKNDLTNGPDLQTFIYNNSLDNNTQISYNTALDFFEKSSKILKSGLGKSLNNLRPDDNQVLVIIKFKTR
jgi:hypothetical protein